MPKYFLTGERGTGKSHIVEKLIELYRVTGFLTRFDKRRKELYLRFIQGPEYLIGKREKKKIQPIPEGFLKASKEIPELETSSKLLVIDEIGFLEECCEEFRRAVKNLLEHSDNCLCVLRKGKFPFIKELLTLGGFETIEVTVRNRESILSFLIEEYKKAGL
ncbi:MULTISPECIES: nucleoside-triphosphatase [Kosmotoga]|uniref:Uncharacterized protein n=1 Tax=Kosmotoga olearia (strain ATCC BAA-1733 / DSM 21960 / TBF 19.5.1) TaxID=521045 RepID=C5CII5_KOSOT|nr:MULTISPECIES: nucleoside-triphosphatase [Kosmotoga]ACR79848.1 hypothetical protein Kole_1146 [Kosmotoga olearia TBF 19.5.1]OAA21203.1 hypothetical protein DU53_06255 [Kosmotoga sp. DU53]